MSVSVRRPAKEAAKSPDEASPTFQVCDLCGEECDAKTDYLCQLDCSHNVPKPLCPDGCNLYHEACVSKYLKKINKKDQNVGYQCPRGWSNTSPHCTAHCKGTILRSHHYVVNPKKRPTEAAASAAASKKKQPTKKALTLPPRNVWVPASPIRLQQPQPQVCGASDVPLEDAWSGPRAVVGADFVSPAEQRASRREERRAAEKAHRDRALESIRGLALVSLRRRFTSVGFSEGASAAAARAFGADTPEAIAWLLAADGGAAPPLPRLPSPPDISVETARLDALLASCRDADAVYKALELTGGDVQIAGLRLGIPLEEPKPEPNIVEKEKEDDHADLDIDELLRTLMM